MATRSATARRRKGYETEVEIRNHRLIVDETVEDGGADSGPRPTELLAASRASCTTITLVMYADRKGWDVGAVEVEVEYDGATADHPASFNTLITVPAELDHEQRMRLLVVAAKCPVHKTLLAQDVQVNDELKLIEA